MYYISSKEICDLGRTRNVYILKECQWEPWYYVNVNGICEVMAICLCKTCSSPLVFCVWYVFCFPAHSSKSTHQLRIQCTLHTYLIYLQRKSGNNVGYSASTPKVYICPKLEMVVSKVKVKEEEGRPPMPSVNWSPELMSLIERM